MSLTWFGWFLVAVWAIYPPVAIAGARGRYVTRTAYAVFAIIAVGISAVMILGTLTVGVNS